MIKIQTDSKNKQYRIVDTAEGEMPSVEGEWKPTLPEAISIWMHPSDSSGFKPDSWDIEDVSESEPSQESLIGIPPGGNIINMMMGKDFQRIDTYHSLVAWCCKVLGFGDHDTTIPPATSWKGRGEFAPEFLSELDNRVQKIDEISLLLRLIEMADAGKRGCRGDQYNDDLADVIKNACMCRLADFKDSLPPSLWHKVHRHELWQGSAETEVVTLSSPNGWVSFSGIRPSQHGAWKVQMKVGDNTYESPQYVEKMGLKARHDGYAKGSHSGVTCQAFHLFNAYGTLWGFEVYLISPKKTVGCEVTKDGRFSLFRNGVYLPSCRGEDIRQGDALFRRIDIQTEDVVSITDLPSDTPRQMESVSIKGVAYKCATSIEVDRKEHRHEGYDYWHPVSRVHADSNPNSHVLGERTDSGYKYDNVLIINEDAVLKHPDHPSVYLKAGYYLVLPVEGETDYQPRQRRGD